MNIHNKFKISHRLHSEQRVTFLLLKRKFSRRNNNKKTIPNNKGRIRTKSRDSNRQINNFKNRFKTNH